MFNPEKNGYYGKQIRSEHTANLAMGIAPAQTAKVGASFAKPGNNARLTSKTMKKSFIAKLFNL